MAFVAATKSKLAQYLGYPFTNYTATTIVAALDAIEALTDTEVAAAAEDTIEAWIAELDTIDAAIATERANEASTVLPELRREYRRHCALLSQATGLPIKIDTVGGGQI